MSHNIASLLTLLYIWYMIVWWCMCSSLSLYNMCRDSICTKYSSETVCMVATESFFWSLRSYAHLSLPFRALLVDVFRVKMCVNYDCGEIQTMFHLLHCRLLSVHPERFSQCHGRKDKGRRPKMAPRIKDTTRIRTLKGWSVHPVHFRN